MNFVQMSRSLNKRLFMRLHTTIGGRGICPDKRNGLQLRTT
jgi:hypothetical protein